LADTDTRTSAVTLFYSYAHEDEPLRDELAGHLKILERRGLIRPWHDRKIVAGQDWANDIDAHIAEAELVLLLVSKDFIESDYIFGVELKQAMQRHFERACDVVPIIVRAVNIEPEDAEDLHFLKLQCLPTDLKAVTSWPNRDEAWTNVAKGLRATVARIRERRPPGSTSPMTPALPAALPGGALVDIPPGTDPVLDGIVKRVVGHIDEAEFERTGQGVIAWVCDQLARETRTLIDLPDQKRVLWVDDHHENNRHETAALLKLQVEVVLV